MRGPALTEIAAIADFHDACSSDRPHRGRMAADMVWQTMRAAAGCHLTGSVTVTTSGPLALSSRALAPDLARGFMLLFIALANFLTYLQCILHYRAKVQHVYGMLMLLSFLQMAVASVLAATAPAA